MADVQLGDDRFVSGSMLGWDFSRNLASRWTCSKAAAPNQSPRQRARALHVPPPR
eukprot:CAMPEP_0169247864 /NCGR_PEP_ID=MMETSP1016-20121227/35525_1 /TAXON_ID=342587 /ORGANISM="Karlodinium micrum, Strain CCMP2283" /LENGTH=54 /DNA_ID=CAMNT_0009328599 /DNA_START=549 /DNA_END=713 /DNA_ORIENTATION=+